MTKQEVYDFLMMEVGCIKPLETIISNLKEERYRDIDIKFLNTKLNAHVAVVVKAMKIDLDYTENLVANDAVMNEANRDRFIKAFQTVVDFYKKMNNT